MAVTPKKIIAGIGLLLIASGLVGSVVWLIKSNGAQRAQKLYLQQLAKKGPVQALQKTNSKDNVSEQDTEKQGETSSPETNETNNPKAGIVNVPPAKSVQAVKEANENVPSAFKAPSNSSKNTAPISSEINETLPVPNETLNPSRPGQEESKGTTYLTPSKVYPSERFLFRNLSKTALDGKNWDGGDSKGPNINVETFTPQGSEINLVLLNNLASNNLELEVIAGVWFPLYWNGHLLLRPGDRILGKATAGKNRDRILVNFYKVVLKDGKTLPLQSVALHTDGTMGIKGYTVGNVFLQNIGPLLTDFASAAMAAYTQRSQSTLTIGDVSVQSDQANASVQNAALQGGQKAFQRLTQLLLEEAEDNRPYIFVPAGTRCKAYLQQYMDVSVADYGK